MKRGIAGASAAVVLLLGACSYASKPAQYPNTEAYSRITDNAFLSAVQQPLSTFSIDVDRAAYSNIRRFIAQDHYLVRVGLQGKRIDAANLPPSNLVFLIDVSGSMDESNKLPLVKASLRLLVDQLRAGSSRERSR